MLCRSLALIAALAILVHATAARAITSFDFSLTATFVSPAAPGGSPPFGLTAVPAAPFQGVVSIAGTLAPNLLNAAIPVLSASFDINGNVISSSGPGSTTFFVSTDANGDITDYDFGYGATLTGPDLFTISIRNSLVNWAAAEGSGNCLIRDITLTSVEFDPESPGCVAGGPNSVVLTVEGPPQIPEPGSAALILFPVLGLAFRALGRGRRSARSSRRKEV